MKLPNAERATVDIAKLREYCLSYDHLRGRHKARVFESVLGITEDEAELLRESLLLAARLEEATLGKVDAFGTRYMIDFWMEGRSGVARVRSAWIIRTAEDFPRLTSCYLP